MTDSQDWWPADFGHYGPFFDPDGLAQRRHLPDPATVAAAPAPACSASRRSTAGPTTATSTRPAACCGRSSRSTAQSISWADLIVLAGNVALETMGFTTFGFAGGRADVWEPDEDVYWGPEDRVARRRPLHRRPRAREPARRRPDGPDLRQPRGPQRPARPARRGPRHPRDLRPDGDERRGDRRADRRRSHVRQDPRRRRPRASSSAPSPRARRIEEQGLGLDATRFGTGKGRDTITSGLEVTWTTTPTQWDNSFFDNLFGYEWELDEEPGRRQPVEAQGRRRRQHRARPRGRPAQRGRRRCSPPTSRCASTRSTSRSRGASSRTPTSSRTPSPGPGSSSRTATWVRSSATSARRSRRRSCSGRTPCPAVDHALVDDADDRDAQGAGARRPACRVAQLVSTAWASASTFRGSDKRGGANGARIRLEPQSGWEVNEPDQLAHGAPHARGRSRRRSTRPGRWRADLAGRPHRPRRRRRRSRRRPTTPVTTSRCRSRPGRTDATQEQTDVESFAALEPSADGFRNYLGKGHRLPAEYLLVDRANLLTLSAPEMTVLVGGLRVLGANTGGSAHGRAHRHVPAR